MKPPEREVFSLSFAVVVFFVIHFHFDAAVVVPEALPEEREPPDLYCRFLSVSCYLPCIRSVIRFFRPSRAGRDCGPCWKLDGQILKCIKGF